MQSTSIDRQAWRAVRALAALLAALLALSACAGIGAPAATPEPGATATAAGTNVTSAPDATASASAATISFAAPEPERSAYEPLIAAFNQQNPDVHVEFVPLAMQQVQSADQLMRQLVSAADTAATFFLRPEDIKNGLVRDLAPLIDADPQFDRDDFYPGALAAGQGGVYILPRTLRLELLSYNKDLWSRRGLPAPKPDWTWSDLLAAAEQLAQKRGDTVDVYGFGGGGDGLAALGGLLTEAGVDSSANVEQLRLDQPKMAAAIERLAGLVKSGAVYANPAGDRSAPDEILKLIADQRVAMWFGTPVMIGPDVPKPAFAVGKAALPPVGESQEGGAEGYVMSAGTAHPETAWRWLSFLSRQEVRRPFMEAGVVDSVPARKSLAERSGFWKQLDPEATAAVQAVLARGASPLAGAPGDRRAIEALGQALAAVVGGQPVAQALAEAQAALDKQIAEAQTTPTATPDTAPVVVATPEASGPPSGATAITFNVPPFQAEQFRRLASEFNKQHPELFVQVKTTSPIQRVEKMTLAKMAEGADCFSWPDPAAASQITGTLDLQPLIDADAQFKLDDYPAALLAPFKRGTTLDGLPYQVRLRALTYNQNAFDAAGLSHPSASWTADDFLNAAKQLTSGQGGDKRYGYAALATQTDDLLFFLGLLGAQIERGDAPNFTDPKVEQAVRFYLDLLRNYSPHEQIQGYSRSLPPGGDAFQLIDEGRVGMWFGLSGDIMIVVVGGPGEAGRQNYTRAIAPPPGADKARPDSFRTNGLYISATSQHPELCWQWLKFLSGDVSALDEGAFPARRSVAESDTFLKRAPAGADAVYAAYRPALDRAPEAGSAAPDQPQLDLFWFFRAADQALQGKDLGRELADAQARTEQYLTCVGSGGAASDCAKQVDSTYDGFAGSNS